jgi:hypothetical protein
MFDDIIIQPSQYIDKNGLIIDSEYKLSTKLYEPNVKGMIYNDSFVNALQSSLPIYILDSFGATIIDSVPINKMIGEVLSFTVSDNTVNFTIKIYKKSMILFTLSDKILYPVQLGTFDEISKEVSTEHIQYFYLKYGYKKD